MGRIAQWNLIPNLPRFVTLFLGGAVQKCQMQRRAKTEPRGVCKYMLSGGGLQRNTADERFSTAP